MTDEPQAPTDPTDPETMEIGAFSVSLNVADLDRSRRFYAALGFRVTGGDAEQGYLMLRNGETTIGLFHGMFDANILTFNPGLDARMQQLSGFTDVRAIEQRLRAAGIEPTAGVDPDAGPSGPAHITLTDPDGNAILIDQFF